MYSLSAQTENWIVLSDSWWELFLFTYFSGAKYLVQIIVYYVQIKVFNSLKVDN